MIEHFGLGDDRFDDRSQLRATVFEIAGGRCEHPIWGPISMSITSCGEQAVELAHIKPRGMGHNGYRDTVNNAIAACWTHARSTDDMTSPEWHAVPAPHDRIALAEWIHARRAAAGWAV